jgi:hypothetical protein
MISGVVPATTRSFEVSDSFDANISKIDAVIAAARARKAEREGDVIVESKPKLSAEERSLRKQQISQERELRKKITLEKKGGKATHMSKVEKAAARLPELNSIAETAYTDIITNFSAAQVSAIALHLQHYNRLKSTELALQSRIETGMTVRISGGDPRFIGCTGTVVEARRIRCFVNVSGVKKPVYCFTSDVAPITTHAATGTDG